MVSFMNKLFAIAAVCATATAGVANAAAVNGTDPAARVGNSTAAVNGTDHSAATVLAEATAVYTEAVAEPAVTEAVAATPVGSPRQLRQVIDATEAIGRRQVAPSQLPCLKQTVQCSVPGTVFTQTDADKACAAYLQAKAGFKGPIPSGEVGAGIECQGGKAVSTQTSSTPVGTIQVERCRDPQGKCNWKNCEASDTIEARCQAEYPDCDPCEAQFRDIPKGQ